MDKTNILKEKDPKKENDDDVDLRPQTKTQDDLLFIALSLLWNSCGNTSIKTISMNHFEIQQHLSRQSFLCGIFTQPFLLGPKQLLRIKQGRKSKENALLRDLYSTERFDVWVFTKNLSAKSLTAAKKPRKENPRKRPRAPPNSLISESSG